MAHQVIGLFVTFQNSSNTIQFKPFDQFENEPFPLYLSFGTQLVLTLLLTLSLWFGMTLRAVIINYLRSPDTNGPVNYLIWIDQLNGILLGIVILVKILAINSPVPLSLIFGESFCEWVDLPGWSFYRILIKIQGWSTFFTLGPVSTADAKTTCS